MSMFQLEDREASPSSIGHAILVGVFCAVALMFGARWFVAYDYQSLQPGDKVSTQFGFHNGRIESIEDNTVTVKHPSRGEYTAPIDEVTEL